MTLPGVLAGAVEHVIDLDVPTLRTAWHLFYKPGAVAEAYFRGDRKRYINPIKFLLFVGALVALAIALFGAPQLELLSHDLRASGGDSHTVALVADGFDASNRLIHVLTIIAMPAFAGVMLLARPGGRRHTFAEHFAFACYVYAEMFLLQLLTVPFGGYAHAWFLILHTVAVTTWSIWACVRFYGGSTWLTALEAIAATTALYVGTFTVWALFLVGYVLVHQ